MFGRPILPSWVAHKVRQLFPDGKSARASYDQQLRDRRGQTVYDFVTYLAERYQCYRIIDVGASHVAGLVRRLEDYVPISGVESLWHPEHYSLANHRPHNFERRAFRHSARFALKDALIVCAGAIGQMRNSQHLLSTLLDMLQEARLAILTSDLHRSEELRRLLEEAGLEILFNGWMPASAVNQKKNGVLCVVRKPRPPLQTPNIFASSLWSAPTTKRKS